MADIRFKDLTTTASTTAADDFFAADGTTNGTRKLSAFSPSFGGNATVGGTLTVSGTGSSTVAGKLVVNPLHTAAQHIESQIVFAANAENYLRISANSGGAGIYGGEYGFGFTAAGDPELRINSIHAGTSTRLINIRTGTNVIQIPGTTASTSTSSGALVVSGGVGVAGAIYAGGALNISGTADSSIAGLLYVSSTAVSSSTTTGAIITLGGLGVGKRIHSGGGLTTNGDNDTHISLVRNGTINIGPDSSVTPTLVISSGIKTAAPSGGTAANWKLGTVATVSPTSPNRTIEVDIGGTIYYIHAKTTNN
jgi:hypothetical protein